MGRGQSRSVLLQVDVFLKTRYSHCAVGSSVSQHFRKSLETARVEFRRVPASRQEELELGPPDSQTHAASLGTCGSQLRGVCCNG